MKRQRFHCFISFAHDADIHTSGKRRNSTIDPQMEDDDYLYSGQLSTSRRTRTVTTFQHQFVFNIKINGISRIIPERLGTLSDPLTTRSDKQATGDHEPAYKNLLDEKHKEDPTQGIPDWLQPFTVNLEDLETHVPAHSSERENSDSEGDASKVVTQKQKHDIYTHFPKNRKRSIPRAENFGDLITAQHNAFNEGSESRNNHWFAVVVQVLATQWIQSYPCKTKTSQETEKN